MNDPSAIPPPPAPSESDAAPTAMGEAKAGANGNGHAAGRSFLGKLRYEAHYWRRCLRISSAFLRRRFIHCNLQVTYRCNFKCRICDFWKTPHEQSEELTLDEIRILGRKLSSLGTLIVSLGGGEPLLRTDLYKITETLAESGHFPILITNGWHVDEAVAKDILRAGLQEISVSVDYADPARHDAMRGMPGSWDRAVRALDLLRKHRPDKRCRVHMISVLMEDNIDDVEPLLKLSRELGVTYFLNLYSHGRGAKDERAPGPNVKVQDRLLALKAKYPEFVSLTSYLGRFD
ncbi:MAG: radical SAM protein, partial [Planctomycetota bacterium]